VRYIEYFNGQEPGRVLADSLQSEHGSWFYRKSNRNMLVEVEGEVPAHDDFRWLTLADIAALLRQDDVINMDARTVLSALPFPEEGRSAVHSDTELLSWFTGERSRHDVTARRVPLRDLPGWRRGEWSIEHSHGRFFDVVALSVEAGSREVTRWTQPLFEPKGLGLTAFLTRTFDGRPHVLVHARVEGGFADGIELGPTVQYTPSNYAHVVGDARPPFLDLVATCDPSAIRYEARLSEEGGRFLNAESRYLIVETDTPIDPPPGYFWATPHQLASLVRHNHYLNVQARTLLSCLTTGAVRL
jgi:oxidase EvaA